MTAEKSPAAGFLKMINVGLILIHLRLTDQWLIYRLPHIMLLFLFTGCTR